MSPPISKDMRERILVWHNEEHMSAADIAALAGCSKRSIYYILSYERDYNILTNPFAKPVGRKRELNVGDLNFITSLIAAKPKIYLDELQEELFTQRDVEVSLPTISRALRRWEVSNKTVASTAMERNELLRATWQAEYGHIPAEYCVWLDEASVDDKTNQRQRGWSSVGQACVCRDTFIRGQRYSVLPALTCDGLIALDIFEGAVNKEKFLQFINEQLAPKLNPYPAEYSVVIMDNCAIHHDEDTVLFRSIRPSRVPRGVAMAEIGWLSRVPAPVAIAKRSKNRSNIQNFGWKTKFWASSGRNFAFVPGYFQVGQCQNFGHPCPVSHPRPNRSK